MREKKSSMKVKVIRNRHAVPVLNDMHAQGELEEVYVSYHEVYALVFWLSRSPALLEAAPLSVRMLVETLSALCTEMQGDGPVKEKSSDSGSDGN